MANSKRVPMGRNEPSSCRPQEEGKRDARANVAYSLVFAMVPTRAEVRGDRAWGYAAHRA